MQLMNRIIKNSILSGLLMGSCALVGWISYKITSSDYASISIQLAFAIMILFLNKYNYLIIFRPMTGASIYASISMTLAGASFIELFFQSGIVLLISIVNLCISYICLFCFIYIK